MKHHDIITIGNGTGQGVILRALRRLTDLDRVTALVGVTDNGGHSGTLRQVLNMASMGDVKTVIASLTSETVWGQLFRHRFSQGRLKGISLGNLMLAAMYEEGGSLYNATHRLSQALEIKAHIIPISDSNSQIVAELSDGSEVIGEWETITRANRNASIISVHHKPTLVTNPLALKSLKNAHWIIVCPGTLWLGIGSILTAPGVREAIARSSAIVVAVGNALTQPGVTDGLSAKRHLEILEKLLGRKVDFYLVHHRPLPENILGKYREKGFEPVVDDLEDDGTRVVRGDLVSEEFLASVDRVHYDPERGYPHSMRHDPGMLARILLHLSEVTAENEKFASTPREERYEVKDF
ncbi:MAG: gluconeogenesis factor YvcK family protein [bacterium]